MCGRFALYTPKDRILKELGQIPIPEFEIDYNLSPGDKIPIVCRNPTKEIVLAEWGFLPRWARDKKFRPINARCETVAEKAFFKEAYTSQRCLVPANGYFEWRQENNRKQPFYISDPDNELLTFAGIWSTWKQGHLQLDTVAIITTSANDTTNHIHDRMPVIINDNARSDWLIAGTHKLLRPYQSKLITHPVSHEINNPHINAQRLIDPYSPEQE